MDKLIEASEEEAEVRERFQPVNCILIVAFSPRDKQLANRSTNLYNLPRRSRDVEIVRNLLPLRPVNIEPNIESVTPIER